MSANLQSERDIAKFFSMSSVSIRPEACTIIFQRLGKLTYFEHKRAYLDKFLKKIKERQILNQNALSGNGVMILDSDTTISILQQLPLSDVDSYLEEQTIKATSTQQYGGSFKTLKMKAKVDQQKQLMNEDQDVDMINTEMPKAPVVLKINPLLQDKVYQTLQESCVILDEFTQFPAIRQHNELIYFLPTHQKTLYDVNESRQDHYNLRLALAEERVFSHTDKFTRAKLSNNKEQNSEILTVYKINSIIGSQIQKWVLGILNQKEDGNYYLEDSTISVKISFSELEYVDPEAFFTENSLLLCCGIYHNETFYITNIRQPPLHARKSFMFKVNECDYFGGYTKKKAMISNSSSHIDMNSSGNQSLPGSKVKDKAIEKDNCLVLLSQVELDQTGTQKALIQLLEGLEQMKPDMIVIIGDFISQKISEKLPYDSFKQYFESLAMIVRDNDFKCLRDITHWVFVPSVDDPGQPKLMPCLQISDFFIQTFKGNGPQRIKNITLATNPCRISYYGKEIVISRYNYFKKLKRNHLQRLQQVQDLIRKEEIDETYKVAKTIVHQGNLMPLSQIVQPIMWSYGDTMNLVPHPDFLILADDCWDYHHQIPVDTLEGEPQKCVHVINPGNFSIEKSFVVIYPVTEDVQPSKISN